MAEKRKISLVLADVDGTLVTEEKILTEWARKAVSALQEAGIHFAITSGRPPLGMAMLFDVLDIEIPIAHSQAAFGQHATANRSQPYYLDVTNKDANKGAVVEHLSRHLELAAQEIATIGDHSNDVLMFKRSGFSNRCGQRFRHQVKAQAAAVTNSYNEEDFAKAMEALILGSAR